MTEKVADNKDPKDQQQKSKALVDRAALRHPLWLATQHSLKRAWTFKNFSEAFAFMTRVALLAEGLGHHPNWSNVYNRLEIELTTHDAGGLTEKDLEMAQKIDEL